MAIRKNKKRIDPRYFLHETTYRDLNESLALDQQYEKPISKLVSGLVIDGRPGQATMDFSYPKVKVGDRLMQLGQHTDDRTTQWIFSQFLPLVKKENTAYPLQALDVDTLVGSQDAFGDTEVEINARGNAVSEIAQAAGLEAGARGEVVLNSQNFWPFMIAAGKWAKGSEYEGGQGQ